MEEENKWWAMLAVGLGVLMATLDVSIVNLALPTLVKELKTDFPTIQWVVLSYVLILTSLMLSVARLGDMLGKRRIYGFGLAVFTLGSLLCGLAPGVGWLIGFRALQGCGAVFTQALGAAIVTEVFPSSERGRALGIIGSIVAVGLSLGPPFGGLVIGLVGWRAIFLINVPFGILALWVLFKFVPRSETREPDQRFDYLGAIVLFATLACYAMGMTLGQRRGFGETEAVLLLAAAAVGLVVFLIAQFRGRHPMLELKLFRNVLFTLNLVMGWLVFIVVAGQFLFPFFLELVRGYPTQTVGLLMMITPLAMGGVAPLAGMLSDRFGSRGISIAGLLVIVGGCLAVSTLNAEVGVWGYLLRLAPLGIGFGLFVSPNNSAIMGEVPRQRLGVASGLMALSRTMGHTTGMPLFGVIFSLQVAALGSFSTVRNLASASPEVLVAGLTGAYRLAAYVVLTAAVLAVLALWIDRRRKSPA